MGKNKKKKNQRDKRVKIEDWVRKTKGDDKKKEEYGRERRRKDNTNK